MTNGRANRARGLLLLALWVLVGAVVVCTIGPTAIHPLTTPAPPASLTAAAGLPPAPVRIPDSYPKGRQRMQDSSSSTGPSTSGPSTSGDPTGGASTSGLSTPGTSTGTGLRSPRSGPAVSGAVSQLPAVSVVGTAATPDDGGYWMVAADGRVANYGDAPFSGSPVNRHLNKPIVGIAAAPRSGGYWLVASDGGVFSYGGAPFYGSPVGDPLNKPVVAITATPDGGGYWLVAADGGVFSYGDAQFRGSPGGQALNQAVVGIAATPDGEGYWLVAADGGVFSYGDAQFFGSPAGGHLHKPIVGMAATADGDGYWLVAADGGVFSYGDAQYYGSLGGGAQTVAGIIGSPSGYGEVESDATLHVFAPTVQNEIAPVSTPPPPAPTASGPARSESTPSGSSAVSTTKPTSTTETTSTTKTTSTTTSAPTPAETSWDPGVTGPAPAIVPSAIVDSSLDTSIDNRLGPGWLGADGSYSTELPDGREAFVFSDTLIGTAHAGGAATLTGIPHNSELVGNLDSLSDDYGGTYAHPTSLIPDRRSPDGWWTAATISEGDDQLIFLNEFAPVKGSIFGSHTGRSRIAVMSEPADGLPSFESLTAVPADPDTIWGNAVLESGGYTYVYGSTTIGTTTAFGGMKIARVLAGRTLQTENWEYWDGSDWVPGEENAIAVNTGNELTGVVQEPGESGYVGVSIPRGFGDTTLDLSFASNPSGPWTSPEPVFVIPQVSADPSEFAYMPTFHPELSSGNGLVVSYDIHSYRGIAALRQNVKLYQPQFVDVSG
jgi:hypothetical protein